MKPKSLAVVMDAVMIRAHRVVAKGDGEQVDVLGTSFKWKARGRDTGYAFAVYEMELEPEKAVPLHMHPFAEFFYVLSGCLGVMQVDPRGSLSWIDASEGMSVTVAANAPHGISNRSQQLTRILSVANFEHEAMFNDYSKIVEAMSRASCSSQDLVDAFVRVSNSHGGQILHESD